MATLNIRSLPEAARRQLRIRAAKAGRSMEAEARAILTDVCRSEEPTPSPSALQEYVDSLYGDAKPAHVVEDLIAERRGEASRP
jgi:plasmid stability protein